MILFLRYDDTFLRYVVKLELQTRFQIQDSLGHVWSATLDYHPICCKLLSVGMNLNYTPKVVRGIILSFAW
jgi:hypothetical protein